MRGILAVLSLMLIGLTGGSGLADEACHAKFPAVRADFKKVMDRLAKGPVTVEVDHPHTGKRVKVTLACETCKRRNYITMKNKQNDRERMEVKKYCRWDRTHTTHRETR